MAIDLPKIHDLPSIPKDNDDDDNNGGGGGGTGDVDFDDLNARFEALKKK